MNRPFAPPDPPAEVESWQILRFELNGEDRELLVAAHMTLADVLRESFNLIGCKVGCDQAVCGACTVLVDGKPVATCSAFAFTADGRRITTVEGLAPLGELDLVQQAFLDAGAVQCGFCIPGMVMSVHALLARVSDPDEAAIQSWLDGNVCRCSGYRTIIDAVQLAARRLSGRNA